MMALLLMIFTQFLLWNGMKCQSNPGNRIHVSQSVTVQEDLCITIPCNFTANYKSKFVNATGFWITNKTTVVATSNPLQPGIKQNFLLKGNPNNGDCTLTITNAKKEDSGNYFFRFKEDPASRVDYTNFSVSLKVTDLREKPTIRVLSELIAGQNATLLCIPPKTCSEKPPSIKWKKRDVYGTWMKLSRLQFIPTLSDHLIPVSCEVTFSSRKIISAEYPLHVNYPPTNMKITVSSSTGESIDLNEYIVIKKNEFLTVNCSAEANPPVDLAWRKKNHIQQDNSIAKGTIWSGVNITEAGIYRCVASNTYGTNEAFLEILTEEDVQQAPEVTIATFKGDSFREAPKLACKSMRLLVIAGMVSANAIVLLLIALGLYNIMKKKERSGSQVYELDDSKKSESVYQDLRGQTNSIYHTVK